MKILTILLCLLLMMGCETTHTTHTGIIDIYDPNGNSLGSYKAVLGKEMLIEITNDKISMKVDSRNPKETFLERFMNMLTFGLLAK